MKNEPYCQTSNISGTLVGNKTVDHSDVVGASPVKYVNHMYMDTNEGKRYKFGTKENVIWSSKTVTSTVDVKRVILQ